MKFEMIFEQRTTEKMFTLENIVKDVMKIYEKNNNNNFEHVMRWLIQNFDANEA
jgi:hypothetical protein